MEPVQRAVTKILKYTNVDLVGKERELYARALTILYYIPELAESCCWNLLAVSMTALVSGFDLTCVLYHGDIIQV